MVRLDGDLFWDWAAGHILFVKNAIQVATM